MIADACIEVVTRRLAVLAERDAVFAEALDAWVGAGGVEDGGFAVAYEKLGPGAWTKVQSPLRFAGFKSVNDEVVKRRWAELRAMAAQAETRSKRYHLRTRWKDARALVLLVDGLDEGRRERERLLRAALAHAERPSYLRYLPSESIARLGATWWGREYARFTGRPINPSRIARILIENERGLGRSHSVLRAMVKDDLRRIAKLESSAAYNGGAPIWPKFVHPRLR
jgi:hypothetical protein